MSIILLYGTSSPLRNLYIFSSQLIVISYLFVCLFLLGFLCTVINSMRLQWWRRQWKKNWYLLSESLSLFFEVPSINLLLNIDKADFFRWKDNSNIFFLLQWIVSLSVLVFVHQIRKTEFQSTWVSTEYFFCHLETSDTYYRQRACSISQTLVHRTPTSESSRLCVKNSN